MKKLFAGLCCGSAGAAVNLLSLVLAPDIGLQVYLSTGLTWVSIGILTAFCNFGVSGALRGVIVALLVSGPSLIYTVTASAAGAVWTMLNTLIVGAAVGYAAGKIISRFR